MLRAASKVLGSPQLAAWRPASLAWGRHFSVQEVGRTAGSAAGKEEDPNVVGSTVDELASTMGTGGKVPFGAGPEAREPGVRREGEAGVARKVESVAREAPASAMEDTVAASAERLKDVPKSDATQEGGGPVPGGAATATAGPGGKPLRGHGEGPRGWGAAESDSEAPPKGVILE